MPQRAYPQMVRELLADRQGGYCAVCGAVLANGDRLEIHHADGDRTNQSPTNLQLVHKFCHDIPGRPHAHTHTHTQNDGGTLSSASSPYGSEARRIDGYLDAGAPATMRASGRAVPIFRRWLLEWLSAHDLISEEEAIAAGAELTGRNIVTVSRWLRPMWSITGPLERVEVDAIGYLQMKNDRRPGIPTRAPVIPPQA